MKRIFLLICFIIAISCKQNSTQQQNEVVLWQPYNDSIEVLANQDHEVARMRYKLIQSKVLNKNEVFLPLHAEVSKFDETTYERIKPLVLERSIFDIKYEIEQGNLSYEELTLFFLYRIYKYEIDNTSTLNTVIALNKEVVDQARALDDLVAKGLAPRWKHPIYGMPILLKDNINTSGMNTTAGSIALLDNAVDDSFIVERLKANGALILGKVNLSEWAYFLCSGCPVGYSAVGGQTLNPYGRRIFETGGSSSGSGTAMAASYAVAAVGTETSGSILSPSSQNSVVGLKPTIGLLSRTGIVPISSTLDTPGPMTRNVMDNAILLSAMMGKDSVDSKSVANEYPGILSAGLHPTPCTELRLGAIQSLLDSDSIYKKSVEKLKELGAEVITFTPPEVAMDGFLSILNIDMRNDLPQYLKAHVKNSEEVTIRSVADAVAFNSKDSVTRIPYGQALFEGILADSTTEKGFEEIKSRLEQNGRTFFDTAMNTYQLDAILSINNYHAGYAAVAKYPALTVPMGYKTSGEPVSLTFIGKPFTEAELLRMGAAFEKVTQVRTIPENYKN